MSHTTWLHSQLLDADNDVSSEIENMVKEKGSTCVSIIVPTHRIGQDRQADFKEVQQAIHVAKQSGLEEEEKILSGIDELFGQIDFTRNKDGVGIFVSPHIKKLVKFPFPVTKKIIVNKTFHLDELLYLQYYTTPYYVFELSEKKMRLFRGSIDQLEEIIDENFPKKITNTYEYNKPSQSGSNVGYTHVKDVEKDKSEIQHLRLKQIFRATDKFLHTYLNTNGVPLVLCGPERDISLFKSVTNHLDNIVGLITNNQQHDNIHDMGVLAWQEIRSFIDHEKLKLIDEFKEKIGEGLAVYGIEPVGEAAKEGKAFKMLVEKDYNGNGLSTEAADTVNEIINLVLEKNGKVIIVEKDDLKDFKKIALINRY